MKIAIKHIASDTIVLVADFSPRIAKLQTVEGLGFDSSKFKLDFSPLVVLKLHNVTPGVLHSDFLTPRVEEKTCIHRTALGDLFMLFMALEVYKKKTNEYIIISTNEKFMELCRRQWFIDEVIASAGERNFLKYYDIEGAVDFKEPAKQKPRQEMFADLLNVNLKRKKSPNYIKLTQDEKDYAYQVCSELQYPIVGIMPKSKSYLRDWNREMEIIQRNPSWSFVVFHHQKLSEYDAFSNVINLSEKTSIMQMCAVASQTDVGGFIDTGLMHIYGNLGLPYICVWGGVMPPEMRVKYYRSVMCITTDASCGCSQVPCWDGLSYDCKPYPEIFKVCMSEKNIPIELVEETIRNVL